MGAGIKSREQYARYLEELEGLKATAPEQGTKDWTKIILLTAIIESYETGFEDGREHETDYS